jgi:FKBP-type peptidyl-prolyl cis-trans isomerase 2
MMAKAKTGDKIRIHYTGKLEDGTVFDSSLEREPLEFTLGQREVIPGIEAALEGMEPGEKREAKVSASDGYGAYKDDMVATVGKDQLPGEIPAEVGQRLEVRDSQGHVFPARIVETSESTVTLDANHPLAGKSLLFDLQLVEIV